MHVRSPKPVLLILVAAAVCAPARTARSAEKAWWNEQWSYRLVLRVPPPQLRAEINTARLNLAEQSALCHNQGQDVRVVDGNGALVPHAVEVRDGASLDVKFLVAGPGTVFHVYYGRPEAPAVEHSWQESLGGLTLETRPFPPYPFGRNRGYGVNSADEIPALVLTHGEKFDRQPWGQINDLENPFGRNDLYIGIYAGALYCPEDGIYTFATNSDDASAFYIGAATAPLCKRNAGTPSQEWKDERNRQAVGTIELRRGVYRIRYYHVENTGAQLARLGWQTPSADSIVTVPQGAFVQHLPAEVQGRQKLAQELNPFFVSRHLYNLVVNSDEFTFPYHHFDGRHAESPPAARLSYHWDFGDGHTATGPSVDHEFPDMATREVTLTIEDDQGRVAQIVRPVPHPSGPARHMTLHTEVEVEQEPAIVRAGDKVAVSVFLKNAGPVGRPVLLETVAERPGAPKTMRLLETDGIESLEPTAEEDGRWLRISKELLAPEGDLHVTFRMLMHGRAVVEKGLAVLSTDGPLGELSQDQSHNLRDREGRLVVLKLADLILEEAAPRRLWDSRTGVVRVVVFDEQLAGPGADSQQASYVNVLSRALNATYGGLRFGVERAPIHLGEEFPLTGRFIETCRYAVRVKPNVVILVCQPESVVNSAPLDIFETYMVAATDQVLSQTSAHVVIVTPPPLPGHPELSRDYARVAKKTGLRKGLAVADVYSRFMLTPNWRDLFKAPGSERRSYFLYPNADGQTLVAHEILMAIENKLGSDLAAGARQMALME